MDGAVSEFAGEASFLPRLSAGSSSETPSEDPEARRAVNGRSGEPAPQVTKESDLNDADKDRFATEREVGLAAGSDPKN